jgi:hypothetical protein
MLIAVQFTQGDGATRMPVSCGDGTRSIVEERLEYCYVERLYEQRFQFTNQFVKVPGALVCGKRSAACRTLEEAP